MNIGILIKKPLSSIFENGCLQQSLFVYQTLSKIKGLNVSLVGFQENYEKLEHTDISIVNIYKKWENIYQFNVIITLSGQFSEERVLKDLNKHNIKVIHYNCGNVYYIFQEDLIFNKHKHIEQIYHPNINTFFDEYWVIPNYKKDLDFYENTFETFSRSIPYVWNSTIINKYLTEQKLNIEYKHYPDNPYAILICEANMNITKTCLMPLLICEKFYNQGNINFKVILLCKKDNSSFTTFISELNIYKKGLLEIYPRMILFNVIHQLKEKKFNPIILSYHRDNPLNFLHLEMCHLNYPLIHNSLPIKNAGYFYETIDDAIESICHVIHNFHLCSEQMSYKINSNAMLHTFHPNNILNQQGYRVALEKVHTQKFKSIILCSMTTDEYSKEIWKECMSPIYHELKKQPYHVKIQQFNSHDIQFDDKTMYILFGYHLFETFPKQYIIYQSERLYARWEIITELEKKRLLQIYRGAIAIWDYSLSNIQLFKSLEIHNCKYVPFYESKENLKRYNISFNLKRNIKVLWLGNIYGRRIDILNTIDKEIPRTILKITNSVFYKKKRDLLEMSKIYLNICGDSPSKSPLNLFKIKYAFLTKSLVISEMTCESSEYDFFKDCIVFVKNTTDMIEKIQYYLNHEDERNLIVEIAYNKYKLLDLKDYIEI
jgi:hypothetical protein